MSESGGRGRGRGYMSRGGGGYHNHHHHHQNHQHHRGGHNYSNNNSVSSGGRPFNKNSHYHGGRGGRGRGGVGGRRYSLSYNGERGNRHQHNNNDPSSSSFRPFSNPNPHKNQENKNNNYRNHSFHHSRDSFDNDSSSRVPVSVRKDSGYVPASPNDNAQSDSRTIGRTQPSHRIGGVIDRFSDDGSLGSSSAAGSAGGRGSGGRSYMMNQINSGGRGMGGRGGPMRAAGRSSSLSGGGMSRTSVHSTGIGHRFSPAQPQKPPAKDEQPRSQQQRDSRPTIRVQQQLPPTQQKQPPPPPLATPLPPPPPPSQQQRNTDGEDQKADTNSASWDGPQGESKSSSTDQRRSQSLREGPNFQPRRDLQQQRQQEQQSTPQSKRQQQQSQLQQLAGGKPSHPRVAKGEEKGHPSFKPRDSAVRNQNTEGDVAMRRPSTTGTPSSLLLSRVGDERGRGAVASSHHIPMELRKPAPLSSPSLSAVNTNFSSSRERSSFNSDRFTRAGTNPVHHLTPASSAVSPRLSSDNNNSSARNTGGRNWGSQSGERLDSSRTEAGWGNRIDSASSSSNNNSSNRDVGLPLPVKRRWQPPPQAADPQSGSSGGASGGSYGHDEKRIRETIEPSNQMSHHHTNSEQRRQGPVFRPAPKATASFRSRVEDHGERRLNFERSGSVTVPRFSSNSTDSQHSMDNKSGGASISFRKPASSALLIRPVPSRNDSDRRPEYGARMEDRGPKYRPPSDSPPMDYRSDARQGRETGGGVGGGAMMVGRFERAGRLPTKPSMLKWEGRFERAQADDSKSGARKGDAAAPAKTSTGGTSSYASMAASNPFASSSTYERNKDPKLSVSPQTASNVPKKPAPIPESPPPSPGPPSALVTAFVRMIDLEAQLDYAIAKHRQLVRKQELLKVEVETLKDLPVGSEAFKDEMDELIAELEAAEEARKREEERRRREEKERKRREEERKRREEEERRRAEEERQRKEAEEAAKALLFQPRRRRVASEDTDEEGVISE